MSTVINDSRWKTKVSGTQTWNKFQTEFKLICDLFKEHSAVLRMYKRLWNIKEFSTVLLILLHNMFYKRIIINSFIKLLLNPLFLQKYLVFLALVIKIAFFTWKIVGAGLVCNLPTLKMWSTARSTVQISFKKRQEDFFRYTVFNIGVRIWFELGLFNRTYRNLLLHYISWVDTY